MKPSNPPYRAEHVGTKSGELENKDDIKLRIDDAAKFIPLDRLCLSPQCGFASRDKGNPITVDDQITKLSLVVDIATHIICQSHGHITLERLQDIWEDMGLHHMLLETWYPETEDQEGDEYAASLDAFEGDINDRIWTKLNRREEQIGQRPDGVDNATQESPE